MKEAIGIVGVPVPFCGRAGAELAGGRGGLPRPRHPRRGPLPPRPATAAHLDTARRERRYEERGHLDGRVAGISTGVGRIAGPTLRPASAAGWGQKRTERERERLSHRWPRVGTSILLPRGLIVGGALALRGTGYDGYRAPFVLGGGSRGDLTRSIRIDVHDRGFTVGGFSPQASTVPDKITANAQLRCYDRISVEPRLVRLLRGADSGGIAVDCNSPLPAGRPPALSATAGAGGSPSHRTDADFQREARNDGAAQRRCERTKRMARRNGGTARSGDGPAPEGAGRTAGNVPDGRDRFRSRRPPSCAAPSRRCRAGPIAESRWHGGPGRCAAEEQPPHPPPRRNPRNRCPSDRPNPSIPDGGAPADGRDCIGDADPASAGTAHGPVEDTQSSQCPTHFG